jgi:hypothetical protein
LAFNLKQFEVNHLDLPTSEIITKKSINVD